MNRQDRIENAVMVHLVRPAEAEGSDKLYLRQIIEKYPELSEFIYDHTYHEGSNTEHLILAAFIFEYPKIYTALLKDCKFLVQEYVDRRGEKMNLKDHTAQLMQKITKNAEVI